MKPQTVYALCIGLIQHIFSDPNTINWKENFKSSVSNIAPFEETVLIEKMQRVYGT